MRCCFGCRIPLVEIEQRYCLFCKQALKDKRSAIASLESLGAMLAGDAFRHDRIRLEWLRVLTPPPEDVDYGGVLGADGSIYSDADPGL